MKSAYALLRTLLTNPDKLDSPIDVAKNCARTLSDARLIYIHHDYIKKQVERQKDEGGDVFDFGGSSDKVFGLPFKTCFFELIGEFSFEGRWKDTSSWVEVIHMNTPFILVEELEPSVFNFFVLNANLQNSTLKILNINKSEPLYGFLLGYLSRLLTSALYDKNTMVGEEYNHKIKGEDIFGKKKIHIINKVVYISPKERAKSIHPSPGKKINWTHKWEVRGHWRRIKSIGKNRDGEYIISGFTWVKDFVKGDGELVVKSRVVLGEELSGRI